jgi:hypothetical protein
MGWNGGVLEYWSDGKRGLCAVTAYRNFLLAIELKIILLLAVAILTSLCAASDGHAASDIKLEKTEIVLAYP